MSATDAQTDLHRAADRIEETIQVAFAGHWSRERQDALAKARIHVARARTLLHTAATAQQEAPPCDTGHNAHGRTDAEFVLTMLDTASLDAVNLLCRVCAASALHAWLNSTVDDDVVGWEIRRLS